MLNIAIIGAGPVGLATAAAMVQKLGTDASVQVVVFLSITLGSSLEQDIRILLHAACNQHYAA